MGRINKYRKKKSEKAPVGNEKRVFSRVPCLLDLQLAKSRQDEGAVEVEPIEAIDLSLLGLGFQRKNGPDYLVLGDEVAVNLYGHHPVRAVVKWKSGDRIGVQFCGRFQDILESWVGDVLAAQGVRLKDVLGGLAFSN